MLKILIVEDEEYIADMYKMKFEVEGFDVELASNGEEGVAFAKKNKPDLIFLDLVMPIMDGLEALDIMRKDKDLKNLKIVVLSNLGQQEEINNAINAGADGFLIKASITPSELVERAREIISGKTETKKKITKVGEIKKKAPVIVNSNGIDVLLIEDNKDIIQMYRIQFQKNRFNLEVAENGAWGLKLAKKQKFDIIVMDMMMPAMGGYEMLENIKKESKNTKTPIIVLSNSAQDEDIEKAMQSGADKYLIKSNITPVILVKEIETILQRTN